MYYLYILECSDKTFYTGISIDLKRRIKEHNESYLGAKYTRGRGPVRLVFSEKFRDKSNALKAEHQMKKLSRREKLKIIHRAGVVNNFFDKNKKKSRIKI